MTWQKGIFSGLCLLLITGCVQSPTPVISTCQQVKQWSAAFQAKMRRELQILPKDTATYRAMIDYKRMRDEARACQAAVK